MTSELIITNGDGAAELMKTAGLGDEILPWRDVLHMGPVPHVGGLGALSELRAHYLASSESINLDRVTQDLKIRDQTLMDNENYDRLSLWFEHDLYDQLQLLQILDFLANNPRNDGALYLMQADEYLGRIKPEDMQALKEKAQPVTEQQLILAKAAWWAFGQDNPESWAELLNEDTSALPYLKPAIVRMLEELPGTNGLSRTERQILQSIQDGVTEPRFLFGKCQEFEEAIFMGDSNFFHYLQGLANSAKPALHGLGGSNYAHAQDDEARKKFLKSELRLTDFGRDILEGKADFAAHNEIDFWWGGTLVTDHDLWRWDGTGAGEKGVLISG